MVERGPNTPEDTRENFEAPPTKGKSVERPIIERSSEQIESVPEIDTSAPTHRNEVGEDENIVPADIASIANGSVTLEPPRLEEAIGKVFLSGIETIKDQNSSEVEDVAA